MPLLVSPIDNQTPMQQIVRNGVEIDRCPVSGGVWLDAGELEKLLGAVHQASVDDRQEYFQYRQEHPRQAHRAPPSDYRGKSYHYDDDYDDYHQKKYGKKSRMKSIFDLFD